MTSLYSIEEGGSLAVDANTYVFSQTVFIFSLIPISNNKFNNTFECTSVAAEALPRLEQIAGIA